MSPSSSIATRAAPRASPYAMAEPTRPPPMTMTSYEERFIGVSRSAAAPPRAMPEKRYRTRADWRWPRPSRWSLCLEPRQQLVMNVTETAVAHDQHMIARPRFIDDCVDQRGNFAVHFGAATGRRQHRASIPGQTRAVAVHAIGRDQASHERVFHRTEPHRIRSRLDHGEDSSVAYLAAQPVDRGGDGRGMMREVVVDGDAIHRAAKLHAAPDAAKRRESGNALLHIHADMTRGGDRRQRVHLIVPSEQGEWLQHASSRTGERDGPIAGDRPTSTVLRPRPEIEAFDLAPAAANKDAIERCLVTID